MPVPIPSTAELIGAMAGMKVVLLNGPPGSGKDTGGKVLLRSDMPFPKRAVGKFSRYLKESVHAKHGHPELPHNHFEDCKDQPSDLLGGWVPRDAYIHESEVVVKPVMGDEYYGRHFVAHPMRIAREQGVGMVIVTDSGFASETNPVILAVGPENVLHLRIRAETRGKSFHGDSRSYLTMSSNVVSYDIWNHDLRHFAFEIQVLVGLWLGIPKGDLTL